MQLEFIYDDGLSKTKIGKNRSNTLQHQAMYISENEKEWHIGFLYTNRYRQKYKDITSKGRSVIISKDFSKIRMAHKNPQFEKWEKINRN